MAANKSENPVKRASSAKTAKAKTASAKTNKTAKTAKTAKAETASAKSSSKTTGTSVKLTAAEKKLVELYRAADAETKKRALKVLKGEGSEASDMLKNVLSGAISQMIKNSTK